MNRKTAAAAAVAATLWSTFAAAQQAGLPPAQLARIDSLFARWSRSDGPGCALGLSRRDTVVLERAWGGAQLEHGVPNTPETIFEAGSVSKQFTAAAVLLLAQQGRLSLDDDVRRHVPELPDYGTPITIRHLIHHTSGLRDWGAVMALAGWPRGTRTYTHAHVLDILSRQRALNHPVGAEYLYSNSNYNLLAIIVERVSGRSLAEFTRAELFEPLGMTRTGWRDDYTRIVPGRAQAYNTAPQGWRLQMPNENIYGNSSLLTTVGDLLKWNTNFGNPRVGGAAFVAAQEGRGRLTTGREISYAGGLFLDQYNGTREVSHDGATAGYRAFLARYPEEGWSVALLCNAGNVNPSQLGHQVVDVLRQRSADPPAARDSVGLTVAPERLAVLAGRYRSVRDDQPLRLEAAGGRLRQGDGPALVALDDRHFTSPSGRSHLLFDLESRGVARIRVWVDDGDTTDFVPAGQPVADSAGLAEYAGTFTSDEAEVTVTLAVESSGLVMRARPSSRFVLSPVYRDGFTTQGSLVRFTRDAGGRVDGFGVTLTRARNVRFQRVAGVEARR